MISILFVCLGNICRSPMAEFVMRDLVRRKNLEGEFSIASAATSDDEIGNPVYPPVRRLLETRGISCTDKTARQLQRNDYARYMTISSAWMKETAGICCGCSAATHRARCPCCWTSPIIRAAWQTRGIPAISPRPSGTSTPAAPPCWNIF